MKQDCYLKEEYGSCWGPAKYKHEGNQCCVLHFRGEDKKDDFKAALEAKLNREDFNFAGAFFPSDTELFAGSVFSGKVNFREATFNGDADFSGATFSEVADFSDATFTESADFSDATFEKWTEFIRATFEGLSDFKGAAFKGGINFSDATFAGLSNFSWASFTEGARFYGLKSFTPTKTVVDFTSTHIERPELISFHTVRLRPSWFIDVDARKFNFTAVRWHRGALEDEIRALQKRDKEKDVEQSYTLLAQACQRLAANAEENRQYHLANEFYYWSMDARRLGSWRVIYEALLKEEVRQDIKEGERQDITRFRDLRFGDLDAKALLNRETWKRIRNRERFGLINGLYWALSGYGVRPLRAFVVLIIMSLVLALLYSWPAIGADYSLQAFAGSDSGLLNYIGYFLTTEMYSLGTLARLNPEPKPAPGLFQTLVIIAGILGPLQIALLLLAIRRKVMR